MADRLQKVLAAAGLGSRRQAERWIAAGRVTVDGRTAQLGDRVAPDSIVRLDGKTLDISLPGAGAHEYLMYHKPAGEICSRRDEQGRPTVYERLPAPQAGRWVAVGRLDLNTSGLLLFTTDGELANRLMHPSAELVRRYAVRIHGRPTAAETSRLCDNVQLDDGPARFDAVRRKRSGRTNTWFEVDLREGRYREVRRLWEAIGYDVSRLIRVAYGPVKLPQSLAAGNFRYLNEHEKQLLRVTKKYNKNK